MRLWYQRESKTWTEALPMGNGRMGAMVYGNVHKDKLCLNEDTLWSGYPQNTQVNGAATAYKKIQKLMQDNNYAEAGVEIEDHFSGKFSESYMPFGNLELEFTNLEDATIEQYTRELSLDTAISTVSFIGNGVKYRREYFVSNPDNAVIINITSNQEKAIDVSLGLTCQMPHEITSSDNTLCMTALAPSHIIHPHCLPKGMDQILYEEEDSKKGMKFCGLADVEADQGEVTFEDGRLQIVGADSVLIKLYMRTSFNGYDKHPYLEGKDCLQLVRLDCELLKNKAYDVIRTRHVEDYQGLYNRVTLSLHAQEEDKPTDVQLKEFQESRDNKNLYELLFHFGRYLTIASSRKGTIATNLQGIWNDNIKPPWNSNYTININTEMNYWCTQIVNLSELEMPLFDLIDMLKVTGEETATHHYGAKGSVSHHNTDIWGLSTPVGATGWRGMAGTTSWNMSYGWLTRHLFSYYEYTLDEVFLKERAYPAIKAAAQFYLDVLIEDKKGYLVITPTSSPENIFDYEGKTYSIANYATMTMAIVLDVFTNFIKCAHILGIDQEFSQTLERAIEKLYPYQIGSQGQLLEWDLEYVEPQVQHRHVSHLYGLHPANQITEELTPDLYKACAKSLEIRGDGGTGWSLGWKINFWARLKDGNRALTLLKNQLRYIDASVGESGGGGTYANMFDAHPPFQIDGNFGACSGMCEMLVQSYDQTVLLLPALPDEFSEVEVSGLRVKNGLELSMECREGVLRKAVFSSKVNRIVTVQIKYKDQVIEHEFLPFEQLEFVPSI